jgi:hypothetical protein
MNDHVLTSITTMNRLLRTTFTFSNSYHHFASVLIEFNGRYFKRAFASQ